MEHSAQRHRDQRQDHAAVIEDLEWMHANGETWLRACSRLGLKPDSVARLLHRAGRGDLRLKMTGGAG